jgi:hypothetical protein
MTKYPLGNAAIALGYISIVAIFFFNIEYIMGNRETLFIPIAMLSLLVLSVLVMATTFFLQPLQMFWNGQQREAVSFLMRTIGSFAVFTVLALTLVAITSYL